MFVTSLLFSCFCHYLYVLSSLCQFCYSLGICLLPLNMHGHGLIINGQRRIHSLVPGL